MSRKNLVSIITIFLVFSISIYGLPQSLATNGGAQATSQASSTERQADPPSSTTRLIREYELPAIPPSTVAFLGPRRGPYGIVYDTYGKIWVTEFNRDSIYRITPTTNLNATTVTAEEWVLPSTQGRRLPAYIVVNETRKVVWFTEPGSRQISRLNWETNIVTDWNLASYLGGVMPLDLVMVGSVIWFTAFNQTQFFALNIGTTPNQITAYSMSTAVGAAAARPTKIATNGTCLFLTDWLFDNLYMIPLPVVPYSKSAQVYPLTDNGLTWDLDLDPSNNTWVTQWQSYLINEQLANSKNKTALEVRPAQPYQISPSLNGTTKNNLNVTVTVTPVTPSVFPGPLNVTGDPLITWRVPTNVTAVTYVPPPARPWEIAASPDGYAWYTEPIYNHIGVVNPDTNDTLLYGVPTAQSWVVCTDVQPGTTSDQYSVWFTEYLSGKIGQLFNATFTDVRVCPSLPAQYPPPSPGSIRWTDTEIWIDAPSNGYDSSHHDSGEKGAINRVYAKVKNMGSSSVASITAKFYWRNASTPIGSDYIPLPPGTPSSQWVAIGSATTGSLAAGVSTNVYVNWSVTSDLPVYVCIGVQVSATGDSDLYDNVGYTNFYLTTPNPPPTGAPITIPGVAVGFVVGFGLMAVIAVAIRKKR